MGKKRIRKRYKFNAQKGGEFLDIASYNKEINSRPKRTPEEQLKHLDEHNLVAEKERAKLEKKIKLAKEKSKPKASKEESKDKNEKQYTSKKRKKKENKK